MNSNEEYNLQDFELITYEPYTYRLFKNNSNIFLMEITFGSHGLWERWIQLNLEEISLYNKEGNTGLEKISKLFSTSNNNSDFHQRYVLVNK